MEVLLAWVVYLVLGVACLALGWAWLGPRLPRPVRMAVLTLCAGLAVLALAATARLPHDYRPNDLDQYNLGQAVVFVGLMAAIAGGAEAAVIPEFEIQPADLARVISDSYARGKPHALVVVAEGSKMDATELVTYFKSHREQLGFDLRATILGHVLRGGNPTAFDRILATRMGWYAVGALCSTATRSPSKMPAPLMLSPRTLCRDVRFGASMR